MVLRLVVQIEDRTARYLLAQGETRVGSEAGSDIAIPHPTVSRRHAVIRVAGNAVVVEDLGSRNGTRVGAQRIASPTALAPGDTLGLGSVEAMLQDVPDEDVEAGIQLAPSAPAAGAARREAPLGSTAAQGSLRAFTLEALPELLLQLASGTDPSRMAQAVGAALFEALPCAGVELLSADARGVLFAARREEPSPHFVEVASSNDVVTVRVAFVHQSFANAYLALLHSAALLVGLAEARGAARQPRAFSAPPMPEPQSLAPRMRAIYADAARVAAGDVSVLILGESGTGKELLARYLHAASARAQRPFVALNCAALPGDLLESELFGIEQGVATGVDARPGKFELADGGTLFLDEIADMARETQAKILRVLQEGEVYRLGARNPRSAHVRVVAATNRAQGALVEGGPLRRDLYHRIADWTVELPPLRERRADIPNLAAHFLAREAERRGLRAQGISRRALDLLVDHDWPGNVRELEREMACATLFLEDGQLLESAHLRIRTRPDGPRTLKGTLEDVERREIQAALAAHGKDVAAAARRLGLGRSTLYRRMHELGLEAAQPDAPPSQEGET